MITSFEKKTCSLLRERRHIPKWYIKTKRRKKKTNNAMVKRTTAESQTAVYKTQHRTLWILSSLPFFSFIKSVISWSFLKVWMGDRKQRERANIIENKEKAIIIENKERVNIIESQMFLKR